MTLNLNHRTEKLKTENKRYRNTKSQNPERLKSSYSKIIGRKHGFTKTRTQQNNDHPRIMHKIKFRSFFKHYISCRTTFSINPHLVQEPTCFPFFAP